MLGIHSMNQPGAELTGPDSWLVFNICNKHGECCTTNLQTNTTMNAQVYRVLLANDPCRDLEVDKYEPGVGGQSFEIQHFGPDGAKILFINFFVGQSVIFCYHGTGIELVGGAGTRIVLTCRTEFMIKM